MTVKRVSNLVLITILALLAVLITATTLSTYILAGRAERALTRRFRTQENVSTVEFRPLRGTVTLRPFEWTHSETGARVKAAQLKVGANRIDLLATLLGRATNVSDLHAEVERAIVTLPAYGNEPIFVASASVHPEGPVGLRRHDGAVFPDPPITDLRIEAHSLRISESLLFETAHLDVRAFHLAKSGDSHLLSGTLAFIGSGATGSFTLPHSWGVVDFGDQIATTTSTPRPALQVEISLQEFNNRSPDFPIGTLHIEAHDFRTIPGRSVHSTLDERRPGLSETLPADGVKLSHLVLNARNDGAVISMPQFEAAGPVLRLSARGEAALAASRTKEAQLVEIQGKIEVEELAISLRPAAIPIIYYLTGGEIPPPEGAFAVRLLTDSGRNARFFLE